MKRIILASLMTAALGSVSSASYRIYALSQLYSFGYPATNFSFDQTDGAKSFSGDAKCVSPQSSATGNVKTTFGTIFGQQNCHGPLGTGGPIDTFTDDTLHFYNPTGLPVQVRFDLVVRGGVSAPFASTTSNVDVFYLLGDPSNSYLGGSYQRQYSNGTLLSAIDPVPLFADFGSGSSINIRFRFGLQMFSLSPSSVNNGYPKGCSVTVTVLTPGASFTSDSGSTYSGNVTAIGPRP